MHVDNAKSVGLLCFCGGMCLFVTLTFVRLEFVYVLHVQTGSVEQPVMAIASPVSVADGSTASADLCRRWRTVVPQSGRPDAVDCSTPAVVQSSDSTAAAAACRGHSETAAVVSHEAFRSALCVDFI